MPLAAKYTNLDGVIIHESRSGVKRDYVPDTTGSTAALVNDSQAIDAKIEYWPYGEIASASASYSTSFTFGGTRGYYTDSYTIWYVRARFLDARFGRWTTVDPYSSLRKPYMYCSNAPVSCIDPSGAIGQDPNALADVFVLGCKIIFGFFEACGTCLANVKEYATLVSRNYPQQQNQMRHCIGACLAERRCGALCSKAVLGHEWPVCIIKPKDSFIDCHNNGIGWNIGKTGLDCIKGCEFALQTGLLM